MRHRAAAALLRTPRSGSCMEWISELTARDSPILPKATAALARTSRPESSSACISGSTASAACSLPSKLATPARTFLFPSRSRVVIKSIADEPIRQSVDAAASRTSQSGSPNKPASGMTASRSPSAARASAALSRTRGLPSRSAATRDPMTVRSPASAASATTRCQWPVRQCLGPGSRAGRPRDHRACPVTIWREPAVRYRSPGSSSRSGNRRLVEPWLLEQRPRPTALSRLRPPVHL